MMINENHAPGRDEITHKRRAVYTALQPFFAEKEMMDVMWLWEEGYSSGQELSMRKFVNEICQGRNRSMTNSAFHRLMAHLQDAHSKLEEDPYLLMLAYRSGKLSFAKTGAATLSVLTESMVVFNYILETFIQVLERDDNYYAFKVREFVAQQVGLHGADLDLQQINELYLWMKYRENHLEYPYTTEQMSLIVHLVYVGSCEYFGPSRADQFLAMSIADVEKTPVAKKFPPKLIL